MKNEIQKLINDYESKVDVYKKKILAYGNTNKRGDWLDIQYILGRKHQLLDSIIELKNLLNVSIL